MFENKQDLDIQLQHITTRSKEDGPFDSILLIYTGGTLGMHYDKSGEHLVPYSFKSILKRIPELKSLNLELHVYAFENAIDSSNITPDHWIALAEVIEKYYNQYDGFVILHGTDTMAYSASALSFLLEGLNKPVIFTGAQVPITAIRNDARENLITSLEIASAKFEGVPVVTEVCIFFGDKLLRGNRCRKVESNHFDAFASENYPPLAEAGIKISYNYLLLQKYNPDKELQVYKRMDNSITVLRLFPGIAREVVLPIFAINGLKAVVLETYGSGNAPTADWFIDAVKDAIARGIHILNVSQCIGGTVVHGQYETSKALMEIGVISGGDITSEAAVAKLMFLLGNEEKPEEVERKLSMNLTGEISL